MHELLAQWLTELQSSDRAIKTKEQYAKIARSTVEPAIGQLRIREARVSVIDRALRTINDRHGYSVAKTFRTVMSGSFAFAVRLDAPRQPRPRRRHTFTRQSQQETAPRAHLH